MHFHTTMRESPRQRRSCDAPPATSLVRLPEAQPSGTALVPNASSDVSHGFELGDRGVVWGRVGTDLACRSCGWGPSGRWFKSSRPDWIYISAWPRKAPHRAEPSNAMGGAAGSCGGLPDAIQMQTRCQARCRTSGEVIRNRGYQIADGCRCRLDLLTHEGLGPVGPCRPIPLASEP